MHHSTAGGSGTAGRAPGRERWLTGIVLTCALPLGAAAAVDPPRTGSHRIVAAWSVTAAPEDGPPMTERSVLPEASLFEAAPDGLAQYTFFPQAGVPGRDLFVENFTDLWSGPGIRDWDCSGYTYDGHRGHDSVIRSFREQEIGVPIFAVLDGVVVTALDGDVDDNTSCQGGGNGVSVDHGGGHRTIYWHLRNGSVTVRPGERVVAGQQLGLTASSGCSSWPHLHFESSYNGAWYEPSAGECRPGSSQWASQPQVERGLAVTGFYLTDQQIPCCDPGSLARDLAPELRRNVVALGSSQTLRSRLDFHNLPPGSSYRLRLTRPGGADAYSADGAFQNAVLDRLAIYLFEVATSWDEAGVWRWRLEINGAEVVDGRVVVAEDPARVGNQPPPKVGVTFVPAQPAHGRVVSCVVGAPAAGADPDHDLVRYTYEWSAGGRVLRRVTTAALSDVLRRDLVRRGQRLSCTVTPSDGGRSGPSATVTKRVTR
jgi:hypothetical protein